MFPSGVLSLVGRFGMWGLSLMLWTEQVVDGLHGVERAEGNFYEDGTPVAHGTVPEAAYSISLISVPTIDISCSAGSSIGSISSLVTSK